MSSSNVDLIELWLKYYLKGSFESARARMLFFLFFFINACDNNKDSLHRLSQAVPLDFKVIWLGN